MSDSNSLIFPDLIELNQFSGDFQKYFDNVYSIFANDFIVNTPSFLGKKVSAQRKPEVDGIHRTFYHITHEGEDESDRKPDIRRMERIRFPKFCIVSCPHKDLLIWENKRGRDSRTLIYNEDKRYLVVLTNRNGCFLFWTAYPIDKRHTLRKLMKEYQEFKKAKTA